MGNNTAGVEFLQSTQRCRPVLKDAARAAIIDISISLID